jgi:hypothetical protein
MKVISKVPSIVSHAVPPKKEFPNNTTFPNSPYFHFRYCKKRQVNNLFFDRRKRSYIFKKRVSKTLYVLKWSMTKIKCKMDFDEMEVEWLHFLMINEADDGEYAKEYKKLADLVEKWDQEITSREQPFIDFAIRSENEELSKTKLVKKPGLYCLNCKIYVCHLNLDFHYTLLHSIMEIPQQSDYSNQSK